jgi:hypothetical protein
MSEDHHKTCRTGQTLTKSRSACKLKTRCDDKSNTGTIADESQSNVYMKKKRRRNEEITHMNAELRTRTCCGSSCGAFPYLVRRQCWKRSGTCSGDLIWPMRQLRFLLVHLSTRLSCCIYGKARRPLSAAFYRWLRPFRLSSVMDLARPDRRSRSARRFYASINRLVS